METVLEEAPTRSLIVAGLVFLMHQVIATGIVFFTSRVVLSIGADLLWIFSVRLHRSAFALLSPPYFPLQIAWALFLGWSLSGYLRHRSILWVWVIPSVVFSYVFIHFPRTPVIFPDRAILTSSTRAAHFFGKGCRPRDFCFDQLYLTAPFFTAAAYSLGAWWAQRMSSLSRYAEVMGNIIMPRACLAGVVLVSIDVASSWRFIVQNTLAKAWFWSQVAVFLWALAMLFVVSTYIFIVVISLIGRRSPVTRWFLNQNLPAVADEPRPA